MNLIWLVVVLLAASSPLQSTGYGGCRPTDCPFSGTTPATQFRNLTRCLTGPDELADPTCKCADLDADGHVSLRDIAAYQNVPVRICWRNLEIAQTSGLGFCPALGSAYRTNVVPALSGLSLLVGSTIEEGDPLTDLCFPTYLIPNGCYVARPFPARRMTSAEWTELSSLVANIPAEGCQPECNGTCTGFCCVAVDPCVIWRVGVNLHWVSDYCYGAGNTDEFRDAIRAVADFVSGLAAGTAP